MKSIKTLIIILLIFLFAFFTSNCNKENDILATYQLQTQKKQILRKDLNTVMDLYHLERQVKNFSYQKKIVRDLVLFNIFNNVLIKEKHNKDKIYKYISNELSHINSLSFMVPESLHAQFMKTPKVVFRAKKLLLKIKRYHPKNVKIKNSKTRPFSQEELELQDKEILERIHKIRNEIISGHITFDEAVKKYSQDYNRKNLGDLGYFTRGVKPFEIEKAVKRLNNKASSTIYRIIKKTDIYQAPSSSSKIQYILNKYIIVFPELIKEKLDEKWIKIEYRAGKFGYIEKKYIVLENQNTSDKLSKSKERVSLPIKNERTGWMLIQLNFAKKIDLNKYTDLLKEKYKDNKETEKRAKSEATRNWNKVVKIYQNQEIQIQFAKYGVDYNKLPSITKKDLTKELVFDNKKISISSQQMNKQLDFFSMQRNIAREDIDDKQINQLFRYLLNAMIYKQIAIQKDLVKSKRFQQFFNLSKLQLLSQYYKHIKWFPKMKIEDKEIKQIYNKFIEKQKKSKSTKKMISFAKAKVFIKRDLIRKRLKNIQSSAESKLLKKYKFVLRDKEFN